MCDHILSAIEQIVVLNNKEYFLKKLEKNQTSITKNLETKRNKKIIIVSSRQKR